MKACTKCSTRKPLVDFVKSKRSKDGRHSWCLMCFAAASRSRRQDPEVIASSKVAARNRRAKKKTELKLMPQEGTLKVCSKCLVPKSIELFVKNIVCTDGRSSWCLACFSVYVGEIKVLKSEPCRDCGGNFPPVAMDFDHVRGLKFRMVSTMVQYSWGRVLLEVAKCDLVCACCHRNRTYARIQRRAA